MRKLLVSVFVLAALLVGLDRVAVVGAEREIARRVQAVFDLPDPVSVDITGFPFLTQALSGRLEEIFLSAGEVTKAGITLSRIDATLEGVTAPLGELIEDSANADVRAERITGTAVISMKTIAEFAPPGIRVTGTGGDTVKVSGRVTAFGQRVPVDAEMKIHVGRGEIRLTPVSVNVGGGMQVPNAERLLTFTVPIPNLPLGLKVTRVTSTSDGLALTGTATDVRFR